MRLARTVATYRAATVLAWLVYLLHAHATYRSDVPSDFFQYWATAKRAAVTNHPSLYTGRGARRLGEESYELARQRGSPRLLAAAEGRRHRFEPAGTPFLYYAFHLLTTDDFDRSYERYRVSCLGLYVAGLVLFLRSAGISGLPCLGLVLVFSEWFYPFRSDVYWSNLSAFQVGLLGVLLGLRRGTETLAKNVGTGLILSFLVVLKPNVMYVVVLLGLGWLIDRRLRTCLQVGATALLAGAAAFAASGLFLGGLEAWREWPAAYAKIWEQYSYTNLAGVLGVKLPLATFTPVGWLLALHVPFVLLARRRGESPTLEAAALQQDRATRDHALIGVGLLLYLISGSLVHAHYFTLAAPAAIHLLRPFAPERGTLRAPVTPAQVAAALAIVPLSMWWFLRAEPTAAVSGWAYVGVFILYAASLADLARAQERRVAQGSSTSASSA